MRFPTPKNEKTYHEVELTRLQPEDGLYFLVQYWHKSNKSDTCGLRLSAAGEVLDYGGWVPKNYNLIRREVNQLATILFNEPTLSRLTVKKQYDGTCEISFKAGKDSAKLPYTYNRKTHRWALGAYLEINPSFPRKALESVTEIVQTMAQKMYTVSELEDSIEKS